MRKTKTQRRRRKLAGGKKCYKKLDKTRQNFCRLFFLQKRRVLLSRMKMHATEGKKKRPTKLTKLKSSWKKKTKKKNTKKTITSGNTENQGRRRRRRKLHTHLPSARNNKVGMDPNDMTKGGRSRSSSSSGSSSRGTKKKGGGRRV